MNSFIPPDIEAACALTREEEEEMQEMLEEKEASPPPPPSPPPRDSIESSGEPEELDQKTSFDLVSEHEALEGERIIVSERNPRMHRES